MIELEPCPIDGGEYLNSFEVICTNCGGRIGYFDTKSEAIDAWNRRVQA